MAVVVAVAVAAAVGLGLAAEIMSVVLVDAVDDGASDLGGGAALAIAARWASEPSSSKGSIERRSSEFSVMPCAAVLVNCNVASMNGGVKQIAGANLTGGG